MGITVALGAGLGGEDGKLGIEINPTEEEDDDILLTMSEKLDRSFGRDI